MQVFCDEATSRAPACSGERPRGAARGKKRKFASVEEEAAETGGAPYTAHRQSVYDISVRKLNRYRQVPEQSLRRSVLVCNTVRSIEREMVGEGMELDAASASSSFLPAMQADSMTLDPIPSQAPSPFPDHHHHPHHQMDWRPAYEPCERTAPSPGGEDEEEGDERLRSTSSCISWSSVLDFSSQSDCPDVSWRPEEEEEEEDATGKPNTSPSASSDSGISTASDEIFGDVDLSLYDFDLLPLSPPSARAAPPSAEELLRCFAGSQASSQYQYPSRLPAQASFGGAGGFQAPYDDGRCSSPSYRRNQ